MSTLACVLGSGPAGVACADVLLRAGRRVVMVSPGRELPEEIKSCVTAWRKAPDVKALVKEIAVRRRSLPASYSEKKLPFGSTYLYDDVDQLLPVQRIGAHVERSLAKGGLSAVWGATVMPFASASFKDWPLNPNELDRYYRQVADLIPLPRVHDDLEMIFQNFGATALHPLNEQGTELMARLVNNRRRLNDDGIVFGRCRSAIQSHACTQCGLCMIGCPENAIFSAEQVITRLEAHSDFEEKSGWIAVGYEEQGDKVHVRLRRLDGQETETLICDRLFIGCGASETTRLVAARQRWFDRAFFLSDTQLITLPLMLRSPGEDGETPKNNALGQVLLRMYDPLLGAEPALAQIYGYNPFIGEMLQTKFRHLLPGFLHRAIARRLMVAMVYLPGALSSKIELRVKSSADGDSLPSLSCQGLDNPRTKLAVKTVLRKLGKYAYAMGYFTPLIGAIVAAPGASIHLAGSLPMTRTPGVGQTDILGRPEGVGRAHVIDSANFPTLPAEHLTLTIMANAARIADLTVRESAA